MSGTVVSTENSRIHRAIVEGIGHHRQRSEFFDVTVVVDETNFSSHRLLLASASSFFSGLFSSGMREDRESRVVLKGISATTFSDVLDALYLGKDVLTNDSVLDIWHAANQLQIAFLLRECRHYLKEDYVCAETCFDVYQNAKLLDCREMMEFTWDYLLQNFECLRRSEGILLLNHKELKKLIQNPDLNVQNEDVVVETVFRWVSHTPVNYSVEHVSKHQLDLKEDPVGGDGTETSESDDNNEDNKEDAEEVGGASGIDHGNPNKENCTKTRDGAETQVINTGERVPLESEGRNKGDVATVRKDGATRAKHLASLLRACRVCLLSGTCLMEALSFQIVLEDPAATAILNEAVQYQIRPDRRHDYCPSSALHRTNSKSVNVIVAVQCLQSSETDLLVYWNKNNDYEWCGLGRLKTPIRKGTAVCFGNNIYIADTGGNGKFLKYDTRYGKFESLPSLSQPRYDLKLVAHCDFVYAVGGRESGLVERFNVVEQEECPGEREWEEVGTLAVKNSSTLCATVVGNHIIVLGTVSGASSVILIQCFNVKTKTSSRLENLPGPIKDVVSFRKNEEAFILQRNGVLWRISPRECRESGKNSLDTALEIRKEFVICDFDYKLYGAILHDNTLMLFYASSSDRQNEWFLSVPGVFNRILKIQCSYRCYVQAVIPKKSQRSNQH